MKAIKVKDTVWQNIPPEKIDETFVDILLKPQIDPTPTDMATIKKAITEHLELQPSEGREHKIQQKGSCAVKSLTCWLHDRMGDTQWSDFKSFYTQRELQQEVGLGRNLQE